MRFLPSFYDALKFLFGFLVVNHFMTVDLCIWSDLLDFVHQNGKNYANPRIRSKDERDGVTVSLSARALSNERTEHCTRAHTLNDTIHHSVVLHLASYLSKTHAKRDKRWWRFCSSFVLSTRFFCPRTLLFMSYPFHLLYEQCCFNSISNTHTHQFPQCVGCLNLFATWFAC